MTKRLLVTAVDCSTAHADEVQDWFNTEHLPQTAAVPGVLSARRYRRSNARAKAASPPRPEPTRPRSRDPLILQQHRYQRKA
jgi:hypothetical protein